jgi:hypothetical protein
MRHGHDQSLNGDPLAPKFDPGYFNFPAGVIDFADFLKIMTTVIVPSVALSTSATGGGFISSKETS